MTKVATVHEGLLLWGRAKRKVSVVVTPRGKNERIVEAEKGRRAGGSLRE